jgi:hypothetical protein
MDVDKENWSTLRKTCPFAVLPTTDLTWTHVGLNLGLHHEKRVNNHLRYGRPYKVMLIVILVNGQVTINIKLAVFWNVMLCCVLRTGNSLLHCYLPTNYATFRPRRQ